MLVGRCAAASGLQPARVPAADPPTRLADKEFWKLMSDCPEPNGNFRSDNLVSNEMRYQYVIPELVQDTRPGGVYLGVGPEQNFTYIAALRPRLAFILDIRRGNVDLHLMYKALFELSADRADFVSRLLSRQRPAGLDAGVDGRARSSTRSPPSSRTSGSRTKRWRRSAISSSPSTGFP